MPGSSTGTWRSGPAKAPVVDTSGLPILQKIRDEFDRQHPFAEWITCEDLASHWQRLAEEDRVRTGRGRLRPEEHQAIALRASQTIKDMDMRGKGRVTRDEWVHSMLLQKCGCPRVVTQINSVLRVVLQHHDTLLADLQNMFEIADTADSGMLSHDEVLEAYRSEQWRLRVSQTGALTCDADQSGQAPQALAADIMKAMDLDDDGQISYADFMAFCLGRRRQEVQLQLYDLSNGSMPSVSPWLLGQRIEGIWHCGVVVFGKEYYFGGELVYDTPGKTCFGQPSRTIPLGVTLWRKDELHSFIVNEMKPIFSRETYDVIYNNCNHFANQVCQWLTGQGIPKDIGEQAEELMQYSATRALIPMLNRWLGNKHLEAKAVEKEMSSSIREESGHTGKDTQVQLRRGMVVGITPAGGEGSPVLGTISGPELSVLSNRSGRVRAIEGLARASRDGCWVTYFGPPTLSARGCRGKVRTELLPNSRISAVSLEELGSAGSYQTALRAMANARESPPPSKPVMWRPLLQRCCGSASAGLMPISTIKPGSMKAEDIHLESPRFGDPDQESGLLIGQDTNSPIDDVKKLTRVSL